MAGLDAIHAVGDSLALLLQRRRGLLAAEGRLAPVPESDTIQQLTVPALIAAPPAAGLSISCYHLDYSEAVPGRRATSDPAAAHGISLELNYLIASWSNTPAADMAQLSWAMLELGRFPTIDRALMANPAGWGRDESLQIVPQQAQPEQIFRIWEALKMKHRLAALFKVRVVRIGYGPVADAAPVVASRFSFAHGDVSEEAAIA